MQLQAGCSLAKVQETQAQYTGRCVHSLHVYTITTPLLSKLLVDTYPASYYSGAWLLP